MLVELFHVHKLGVSHQFVVSIRLEAFGRNRPFSSLSSQKVLSWVLELVTDGVGLELAKSISCC